MIDPFCIGLMIGDPNGIGPEVCVKALAANTDLLGEVVLVGSRHALENALEVSQMHDWRCRLIGDTMELEGTPGTLNVLDPDNLAAQSLALGSVSAECGRASFEWARLCEQLCEQRRLAGWIMAPVSAEAFKAAGVADSIDDLQPAGTFMFRINGNLRVIALSEHIPISAVPGTVTRDAILELLDLFNAYVGDHGMHRVRYAIAGLNPHAVGAEEVAEIGPAVEAALERGLDAVGPLPPDSVFRRCIEGEFDVVVSMYHDQGQVALKTAAFLGACTLYVGVPYIRMTVPHGTAVDIAGKGVARHESMSAALRTSSSLMNGRGFPSLR